MAMLETWIYKTTDKLQKVVLNILVAFKWVISLRLDSIEVSVCYSLSLPTLAKSLLKVDIP